MLQLVNRVRGVARRRAALKHMTSIANIRPLDLNIEVSNFCASSCVFCPNSKAKRIRQSMDMSLFMKICDDYSEIGGGYLGMSSMQSDLFSDKMLLERLDYLDRFTNIKPYTTTFLVGAAKFSDEQLLTFLKSMKSIEISFGGYDKDSYKIMYGINAFEAAKQQLDRIALLIQEHNINVRVSIYIRTNDKVATINSEFIKSLPSCFSVTSVKDKFFSWGGIIKSSDLPDGAKLNTSYNTGKSIDCAVPWASLSVNVDGKVVGCGCVDWNAKHVIGDLKSESIQEVWQGAAAQDFRRGFSRGKIPELCVECDFYSRVDHAFSRPELENYKPTDSFYYEWS